ncbi:SYN3 [Cordylochernes scorpioides]|uniref:SYN3 n=1 Tax=Cordylochernes scorpioides TaxID=51811 RepID=A0ABY6KTA9_9ARAC|nr:SYN3 [Cordylochernes scorpioides]
MIIMWTINPIRVHRPNGLLNDVKFTGSSFRPDFLLIRQHFRDALSDYRPLLLGLKYGGVPSVNSLHSLYNFQDKPWVFSQLLQIQRKLGPENFPLIEQVYFPNHKEMVTAPRYPCVVKLGHAHGGLGKLKVENHYDFQDVASVVAVTGAYCVVQPFIDAKFDLHVQKIASNYKAFMRKSISGNWKANIGSAMLEQVPMTDRYRAWIDAVAEMFGGLDVCALEALHAKDGREYITETGETDGPIRNKEAQLEAVNDSSMTLLGETQEEDRRLIAELVATRMQTHCKPVLIKQTSRSAAMGSPPVPPPPHQALQHQVSQPAAPHHNPPPLRTGSQAGSNPGPPAPGEEPEDTMRNLRKTFAGIFGDM